VQGLHRFGQGTLLWVYRWLVLSLIAYILAHWAYLSTASADLPDWRLFSTDRTPSSLAAMADVPFFTRP
jgi:hypothetical protein